MITSGPCSTQDPETGPVVLLSGQSWKRLNSDTHSPTHRRCCSCFQVQDSGIRTAQIASRCLMGEWSIATYENKERALFLGRQCPYWHYWNYAQRNRPLPGSSIPHKEASRPT